MKRLAFSITAAAALFVSSRGLADPLFDPPSSPECQLADVNKQLNDLIVQIRNSPAHGHAAGHYRQAVQTLAKAKEQLARGCEKWVADQHKTTTAEAPAQQ
jgi:hypothetical protein